MTLILCAFSFSLAFELAIIFLLHSIQKVNDIVTDSHTLTHRKPCTKAVKGKIVNWFWIFYFGILVCISKYISKAWLFFVKQCDRNWCVLFHLLLPLRCCCFNFLRARNKLSFDWKFTLHLILISSFILCWFYFYHLIMFRISIYFLHIAW